MFPNLYGMLAEAPGTIEANCFLKVHFPIFVLQEYAKE